eukprot:XP_015583029.1 uncharacterized protein LOC8268673 [Ricinus communis]
MSDAMEQALNDLEKFCKHSGCSLQKRLSFHIEHLGKSLNQRNRCKPATLRTWLENQRVVVEPVPVPSGVSSTYRLAAVMRSMFRGFLKEYRTLYLQGKAHGRITLDNILVYDQATMAIMLINGQDLDGNIQTYKADFAAIADVLREMLGRRHCPKDLEHFLAIITREELPTGMIEAFVFNHPTFWSSNEIVRNITAIRLSYIQCGTLKQIEFTKAALQIPTEITVNWQSKVKESPTYEAVLANSPTKYGEFVDGLALFIFFRNALQHARKVYPNLKQNDIENELYGLFPDFMADFIEKTYGIADVREICGR